MKKYIVVLGSFILIIVSLLIFDNIYLRNASSEGVQSSSSVEENIVSGTSTSDVSDVIIREVIEREQASEEVPADASQIIIDAKLDKTDWNKRKDSGLTSDVINQTMIQMQGLYAYEIMQDDLHQLYAEIYLILLNQSSDVIICSLDEENIDFAYACVMTDHPEIFYTQGYIYTRHIYGKQVQKVSFSGNYTHTAEEVKVLNENLASAANKCLINLPIGESEYNKVKFVYEYIIMNTDYVLDSPENQNICSVLLNGSSVCQGYAKTMQYLLTKLGIECTFVTGDVRGEGHSWNLVKIDGNYYYIDVTWGDASYITELQEDAIVTISYEYFLVTTDEISRTHTIDNLVPMPRCVASEANYYIKEGLFFESVDEERIALLFRNAYDSNAESVMIKCADRAVYDQMKKYLIDEQAIFDYLDDSVEALAFNENGMVYTYTFLLSDRN